MATAKNSGEFMKASLAEAGANFSDFISNSVSDLVNGITSGIETYASTYA